MSVNSSTNSSFHSVLNDCYYSKTIIFIYASFVVTNIVVLLPLLVLILFVGLQRWRRRCSSPTSETLSHSDFFTYNVVSLELISMLGACLCSSGAYVEDYMLESVGRAICSITSPGQTLFHVLTSVERYVAVVHPITYLGLRQAGGLRIRNVSTGCVWLLCVVLMGFSMYFSTAFGSIMVSLLLVSSLVVISLSGFSILCVLNNAGPGQVSGYRVDQAKQRAFHTIMAIMAALVLRFVGVLVCNIMLTSPELTDTACAVGFSAIWLTLPCSLVLPLLFLQRAGKLAGWMRFKTTSPRSNGITVQKTGPVGYRVRL